MVPSGKMVEIQAQMIKVAILGAEGKMGSQAVQAVNEAEDMQLVAQLGSSSSLDEMKDADVMVDLTTPQASEANVAYAIDHGINCVVGTSGWSAEKQDKLAAQLQQHDGVGVFIAPNFAVGSVLASSFAAKAAQYFDSVEIIEMHHPQKLDAPSGTAVRTAELIADSRKQAHRDSMPDATEEDGGARGADIQGVKVHAVRLQGLVAHQEVLLGNPGEQLVIRHDSFDRASFMPGVLLGIREVLKRPGLTVGLDKLLDL
ncbi:MAG: 4-hydroxy-tetrahydrodipicolinate reductase [Micrococcaceae bacterium]